MDISRKWLSDYVTLNCDDAYLCDKLTMAGIEVEKVENAIETRSFEFAVRMVNLYKHLTESKKEFVLSKQLLRSGTSIGTNINETNYGQSPADFISKMHIALKENAETEYWIKLLYMSEYIDEKMSQSLLNDCLEIKRILIASINTAKENK